MRQTLLGRGKNEFPPRAREEWERGFEEESQRKLTEYTLLPLHPGSVVSNRSSPPREEERGGRGGGGGEEGR